MKQFSQFWQFILIIVIDMYPAIDILSVEI